MSDDVEALRRMVGVLVATVQLMIEDRTARVESDKLVCTLITQVGCLDIKSAAMGMQLAMHGEQIAGLSAPPLDVPGPFDDDDLPGLNDAVEFQP